MPSAAPLEMIAQPSNCTSHIGPSAPSKRSAELREDLEERRPIQHERQSDTNRMQKPRQRRPMPLHNPRVRVGGRGGAWRVR